jgi:hypothetical protein
MPSLFVTPTSRGLEMVTGETLPDDGKAARRFQIRLRMFARRGLDSLRATELAERLTVRDEQRDDRRLCVECAHLRRGWNCAKGDAVLVDVLQRCFSFRWERA